MEDAFSVQPQRVGYARLDLKRQAAQGGAIIAANTDFHHCLGLDEGTALGKSIAELIPQWNGQHMEDQEASPRWHWGPVGQSEQPHLSIMIPEDGQWHVLCLALPVQEWEEQQMRAQTIFTMAPIGLCHFDARGKVFDLNPTFSEVIGSKREHIIGVDLLQLPERSVVSGVKQALAGKPAYFEGRYTAVTSGKTTPVRAVFVPISVGGDSRGGVAMVEDRSHEEDTKGQLQQRVKELACYNGISEDMHKELSQEEFVRRVADHVRQALRRPEHCRVAVHTESVHVSTGDQTDYQGCMDIPIPHGDGRQSMITVCYRGGLGPVREERALVEHAASFVGLWMERVDARENLKRSEAQFRGLVENAHEVFLQVTEDGICCYVSPNWPSLLGYSVADAKHRSLLDFIHQEDREKAEAGFRLAMERQFSGQLQVRFVSRQGQIVWTAVSGYAVNDGTRPWMNVIVRDITEQVKAEAAREESESRFQALFNNTENVAVQGFDAQGFVRYWNPASETLYGYAAREAVGRHLLDLIVPQSQKEDVWQYFQAMVENGRALPARELHLCRSDGAGVVVYSSHSVVQRPGYPLEIFSMDIDISERKRAEERLQLLATTDELTGLHNRRHFLDQAHREIERAQRYGTVLSLLIIDIDHFKEINDQHGHSAGDTALQHIAALMSSQKRDTDILGRIGGEEFALLLPSTTRDSAETMAQRLRRAAADQPLICQDCRLRFTLSIGGAEYGPEHNSFDALFRAADKALYQAKQQGRNRVQI